MSTVAQVDTTEAEAEVHHSHTATARRRWPRRIAMAVVIMIGLALVAGVVTSRVQRIEFEPVLSGSMRPGIQPGALAVLKPVPVTKLMVGDIVAYLPPDYSTPVMHRIVSLNAKGMVTKGDANSVDDPWGRVAPQSDAVAQLVAVIPALGWVAAIKSQALIVLGVVLLIVLVIFLLPERQRTGRGAAHVAPAVDAAHEHPKPSHKRRTESRK